MYHLDRSAHRPGGVRAAKCTRSGHRPTTITQFLRDASERHRSDQPRVRSGASDRAAQGPATNDRCQSAEANADQGRATCRADRRRRTRLQSLCAQARRGIRRHCITCALRDALIYCGATKPPRWIEACALPQPPMIPEPQKFRARTHLSHHATPLRLKSEHRIIPPIETYAKHFTTLTQGAPS